MISSNFYNKRNLVFQYLGGKVKHFPIKDPSITLEWYRYTIKDGEDLYKIAERIFGKNLGHLWTYIADNNYPRHPDDWRVGDVIKLPKLIIRDSNKTNTSIYDKTPSTTTKTETV